jgi:hypothetical protein
MHSRGEAHEQNALCFIGHLCFCFVPRAPAAADKVLIYDPTVTGGTNSIEAKTATQLGFTVDLVTTASAWQALTATDFNNTGPSFSAIRTAALRSVFSRHRNRTQMSGGRSSTGT